MPHASRAFWVCPTDGTRLVHVTATNPSGDTITRWECPFGDWAGHWYMGEPSGDNEALPEFSRETPTIASMELDRRFGSGRTTLAVQISAAGDNTIVTPAAGKRLRVVWLGLSTSQNNSGEVLAIAKFGAGGSAKYRWQMGNPGAFMHWETLEGGTNEAFIINLSGAQPVQVNVTFEEYTPV